MAELLSTMPQMPLTPGMRVQFEAIDPTSGAAVAGVTVSRATIYANDGAAGTNLEQAGPFMLVPGPSSIA